MKRHDSIEAARQRAQRGPQAITRADVNALAKTVNVQPAVNDEASRKVLFGQGRHTVR